MCHVYVRADGLGATAVVNEDYPDRVAFTLLNTILDEFVQVHGDKWQGQTADDCLPLCVFHLLSRARQGPPLQVASPAVTLHCAYVWAQAVARGDTHEVPESG